MNSTPVTVLGMPALDVALPWCFKFHTCAAIRPDTQTGFMHIDPRTLDEEPVAYALAVYDVIRWPSEHHYAAAACEAWLEEVIAGAPHGASLPLQRTWRGMLTWLQSRYTAGPLGMVQSIVLERTRLRELHRWVATRYVETGELPDVAETCGWMDRWPEPAPAVLAWLESLGGKRCDPKPPVAPSES